MSLKEDYQQKMEAKMNEWSSKLGELTSKAEEAQAETKIQIKQEIEALRQKQDVAQEKLKQLKEGGEDAWEDLKTGIDHAWDDVAQTLKSLKEKVK